MRSLPRLLGSLTLALPLALGAQAPRDSLLVSPSWLAARLDDPRVVVLQVERNPATYAEGHIAGARLVPFGRVVVERAGIPNELPPVAALDSLLEGAGVTGTSRIILVGEPLLAARLFFTLDYLGLGERTALLDGGLPAWRAAGLPLTQAVPAVTPGRLDLTPRPELVVDADWVRGHLGDSSVALLDARPAAEYAGTPPGDGVPRGGHIPGAKNFFWRLALTSPEPGRLKGAGEVAKLLARAGAVPGRTVVTYCRTGVQASYLYFVARTLGLHPRLYDGSFLEWSRRAELPVD